MTRGFGRVASRFVAGLLYLAMGGCASYHPEPLPTVPDLTHAPELTVPAKEFLLPGLKPHAIAANGLDATTVVMLAVFNDPDLRAARLREGVADAQMLQAGLLPDPQLSAGFAMSARNYGGALGLSEDIQALVTRGAAKAAASDAQKQVHLGILWQEWQVAARASELFIQVRSDEKLLSVLREDASLLAGQYHADLHAMQRGDATAPVVSADLVQLSNAQASVRQRETAMNLAKHQLNELLGLEPDVRLHLVGAMHVPELSRDEFRAAVAALPQRRADLLALRAGYQSQEETVREAILAQFPAMSAGLEAQRDPVEGVNDFGPQVTLTLPIFNRNRGQIAIQRATRAVLHQTYQARLDAAVNEADEVWRADQILATQLAGLARQLDALKQRAKTAKASLQKNNLDTGTYAAMESSYLAKRAEALQLRASMEGARAALRILLGLPLEN